MESLRAAMAGFIGDGVETQELRNVLCRAAGEAREKGIRSERLLVVLKEIWFSLPAVDRSRRDEQQRLLQRLIGHCLDEYYK